MLLISVLCCFNAAMAQTTPILLTDCAVLEIQPSTTDPTITAANTPHLVMYNPKATPGKLLLFMPGTNGIALKGPKDLFLTAVNQGYHVINLSYINTPAIAQICKGATLEENRKCTEEFRTWRIYGTNPFSLVIDEPQDAIVNRLTKLLGYLAENDPAGNWSRYIENGQPKWAEIAVSGQSQGGGMAAFIAKKHLVARVIDFSGGWDYAAKGKIADWYFTPSVTPVDRYYGTYHTLEPAAKIIKETYEAMKIPSSQIYAFDLAFPEGKKAHSNGVRNTNYMKQWIELLGKGTSD